MHNYSPNRLHPRPATGLQSFRRVRLVVDETEHAVLIVDGRITRVLPTGVHRIMPRHQRVIRLPATEQTVIIPGQEMLTVDGAGVRTTLAATVAVNDPMLVVRRGGWHEPFHLKAQLAVRRLVGALTLDELLVARTQLQADLNLAVGPEASALGLDLVGIDVRDFIVPGELKRAVADVVAARLSGQATLERARGETAALRSLAN
ncbi:MAG: SPFH domain-containing protein, partial [Actinomycetota bacterium]